MTTVSMIGAVALAALAAALGQGSGAAKADRAALQGDWVLVSAVRDGQTGPAEAIKDSRRSARGDTTTVVVGGQLVLKATFVLDPAKKPKAIDYHVLAGMAPPGAIQLGIYELKGDTIRFCFAPPAGPRPTDFVSRGGDRHTCSVWRRAGP